ncbi:D-amino-acid transaminase [Hazenella sp. IB182353]|uniref:D-amino-acid transaminase n=1 Tax=Polycladospora coralii TaxID=2771432 RepID=UPI0017475095|nr:D-amino-acid transaminase [Polycladospora coralii]MBS7530863.1 D-amino-acid transaminase [Polycladospora coralii]
MLLYHDQIKKRSAVNIDIEDRAYQFGDGVYEVIRIYNKKPFYLDAHLDRFVRSSTAIKIELPYPIQQLKQLLLQLIEQAQLETGNIYLQISRGVAPRSHAFPGTIQPVVIAYPQNTNRPISALNEGVCAITTPDIRWLRCDIKSLNLLGACLAKQEAIEREAQEAILIRDGYVTEGSSTNIFVVHNQTLYTHPANHLILNGVTRSIVLNLADKLCISTKESAISENALESAEECFMTSTNMEICPIVQINDKKVGTGRPGIMTKQLQEAFEHLIGK